MQVHRPEPATNSQHRRREGVLSPMSDAIGEMISLLTNPVEKSFEPVVDVPEDHGLYEVVYQTDSEPREVRRYEGHDVVPRVVSLVRGNVDEEAEPPAGYADPDEVYTRLVLADEEIAVTALEGSLDMGEFARVDADAENGDRKP